MVEQDKAVEQGAVEEQAEILKMPQTPYAFLLVGNNEVVNLAANTFPLPILHGALVKFFGLVQEAMAKAAEKNGTGDKTVAEEAAPPPESE